MKKSLQLTLYLLLQVFTATAVEHLSGSVDVITEQLDSVSPFQVSSHLKSIQPILAIESWGLYSKPEDKGEDDYPARTDLMFRRFRFGAKGTPYNWLSYSFQFHIDRFGEDVYIPVKGAYSGIGVWNAYLTAKILKGSQLLNLHVGYYWAGISREYITSAYAVGSLDKTRANWFLRHFITGKGNGIESGIGLGGLKNWNEFGVSYRFGIYEPAAFTSPQYASKLYTGRVSFSLGDAEQQCYKYLVSGNSWRKRNGITIGAGLATQRNGSLTDSTYFSHSYAYGADFLIERKGLRIEGEYYMFTREADNLSEFNGAQYHIRFGYSLIIQNKFMEPVISYDKYSGSGNNRLYKYIGVDNTWDFGLNWYLNKDNLKLAIHYVLQDGTISNTGDYYGLALQVKI